MTRMTATAAIDTKTTTLVMIPTVFTATLVTSLLLVASAVVTSA